MASRIEYRAEFDHDVRDVFAAQSDEAALRARLRQLGGKNADLQQHERTSDGVRYTLLQCIEPDQLPQAARALHKGDLVVHRDHAFRVAGDGYTGHVTVSVDGIPGEITARAELTPVGDGAVQRITGEATVRVPLVGGKLESVIAEQVTKLLRKEAEFTERWLAGEH